MTLTGWACRVQRSGNGLDRRMHQFTNAPGTVQLSDNDQKLGDGWFDEIDVALSMMRDRLAWYHVRAPDPELEDWGMLRNIT